MMMQDKHRKQKDNTSEGHDDKDDVNERFVGMKSVTNNNTRFI